MFVRMAQGSSNVNVHSFEAVSKQDFK